MHFYPGSWGCLCWYLGLSMLILGVVYVDSWDCLCWFLGLSMLILGIVYVDSWDCLCWFLGLFMLILGIVYVDSWGCQCWFLGLPMLMFCRNWLFSAMGRKTTLKMFPTVFPNKHKIKRRLENRLRFPIVDEIMMMSFWNVVCLLCIFNIDEDIQHLKDFVVIYYIRIWTDCLISPSIL